MRYLILVVVLCSGCAVSKSRQSEYTTRIETNHYYNRHGDDYLKLYAEAKYIINY